MADRHALRVDTSTEPPIPPIAAIFLVVFDHRKGYTLAWHRSLEDVPVKGVVEFKSLPSGLHNVEEDLVYFVDDNYGGLSAFINQPDEQSERAARMLAVGVLVPLDLGRLGRNWRHAEALKKLARAQVQNVEDKTALEEYWEKHRLQPGGQPALTPYDSTDHFGSLPANGYRKSRSMSATTAFISSHHALTPHHPALTLLRSIKLFGPLIFPLYRAALLRKRILVVTETPVEFSCNLVYNLSILSSVSRTLLSLLPDADRQNRRLRPLFTVGVLDIPQLEQSEGSPDDSWIACTTDDVLSTKPNLYDLVVLLPGAALQNADTKVYPRMVPSRPQSAGSFPTGGTKSTQRDFHRFVHLQQSLRQFPAHDEPIDNDDSSSVSSQSSSYSETRAVVEHPSWSRVAYTSLVWWASAGDRRGGLSETEEAETEQDLSLLPEGDGEQTREVALVAYFHRLTAAIFQTIAEAVARADGTRVGEESYHDDEGDVDAEGTTSSDPIPSVEVESEGLLSEQDESQVEITQDDMAVMGLDSWSPSDKRFVEELVEVWWGRKAVVRAAVIECCGLRIL